MTANSITAQLEQDQRTPHSLPEQGLPSPSTEDAWNVPHSDQMRRMLPHWISFFHKPAAHTINFSVV